MSCVELANPDRAVRRLIKTLDQLGKRALAAAGGTEDRNRPAVLDFKAEIAIQQRVRIRVPKSQIYDFDGSVCRSCPPRYHGVGLYWRIHDVPEPSDRDGCLLKFLPQADESQH